MGLVFQRPGRFKLTDEAMNNIHEFRENDARGCHGSLFGRYLAGSQDIIIDAATLYIDQLEIDERYINSDGCENWLGLWAFTPSEAISETMRLFFNYVRKAKFDNKSLILVISQGESWSMAEWFIDEENPRFMDLKL